MTNKSEVIKNLKLLNIPLDVDFSLSDVQNSYRVLAQMYHPDANKLKNSHDKMVAINLAKEYNINNFDAIKALKLHLDKTVLYNDSRFSQQDIENERRRAAEEDLRRKQQEEAEIKRRREEDLRRAQEAYEEERRKKVERQKQARETIKKSLVNFALKNKVLLIIMSIIVSASIVINATLLHSEIYFINDFGPTASPIEYYVTDTILELPTLSRDGYIFDGWYNNKDLTGKRILSINKGKIGNQYLYAKWIPKTYTITFEENGGSSVDDIIQEVDTVIEEPFISREGYTFLGWYMDQIYTIQYIFNIMSPRNLRLYAKWQVNQYELNFELNGGTGITYVSANYGTLLNIPTVTREGFEFMGWYLDSDFVNPYDINTMPADNLTLYAKWERKNYFISFLDYDGSIIKSENLQYDQLIASNIFPTDPFRIGHIFTGWSSDLPNQMPNYDIEITALYTRNQYDISFEENGGSAVANIIQYYDYPITSSTYTEKEGYTFDGWYVDESFTLLFNFSHMPATHLTLYAKWNIDRYELLFVDYDDGVISQSTYDYDEDLSVVMYPANPTRLGYTFTGWNYTIPLHMPSTDITIRASYSINQYDISFFENGGSLMSDLLLDYMAPLEISDASKSGYTFIGWYTNDALTELFNLTEVPAYNLVLYAKWQKNNITFDSSMQSIFNDVVSDSNGYLIAVGNTTNNSGDVTDGNNGENDALIIKYDYDGQIIWQKTIGGSDSDAFSSIIIDRDGNYVVSGYTSSKDYDMSYNLGLLRFPKAIIYKFDPNGEILWSSVSDYSYSHYFKSITEDADGNYIAVGGQQNTEYAGSNENSFLVKFSTNGDILWSKVFIIHSDSYDYYNDVIIDSLGFYVAVGRTHRAAIISKIDSNGELLWTRHIFDPANGTYFTSLSQDLDGNYIAVGVSGNSGIGTSITDGNNGSTDGLIVKFDQEGNKIWDRTIGGSNTDYFNDIIISESGKIYIVGTTTSNDFDILPSDKTGSNAFIVEINSVGQLIWQKSIGGDLYDDFDSISIDSQGFVIISGKTYSINKDITDDAGALIWIEYINQ